MDQRVAFDLAAYELQVQQRPCFVCGIVSGDPLYRTAHELIYEDDEVVVFLNRYPTLRGYTLVCPRRHVERVVGELSEAEYMRLQHWIYNVGQAIQDVVPTERLYVMSLGSQQGNRHVHWHLAPLPPGIPYSEQQLAALSTSRGILRIDPEAMASLASSIRARLVPLR